MPLFHKSPRWLLVLFLLGISCVSEAQSLEKGFEALKIYNYFKAKEIFDKHLKRDPVEARFGLATIYSRKDNPFFNLDTAYTYVLQVEQDYPDAPPKQVQSMSELGISPAAIKSLHEAIELRAFQEAKSVGTVPAYETFMTHHATAPQASQARLLRDSTAFVGAKQLNTPAAYQAFTKKYPGALQVREAMKLYDLRLFDAVKTTGTPKAFADFLKQYPKSPFRAEAEDSIFTLSTHSQTKAAYADFVKTYPANPHVNAAWEALYTLATADHTAQAYMVFQAEFPNFPDKARLKRDLALTYSTLYPIRVDGKYGYCDSAGTILIEPQYDFAEVFSEGLASVEQGGKLGYISKRGNIAITLQYDEANNFSQGCASVSKAEKYGLIDKTGKELLPITYSSIGDFSEGLAPVKNTAGTGFVTSSGQLLIPCKYKDAGSFSEGLAWVKTDSSAIGFINKMGKMVVSPAFDWVDDFHGGIARVRKGGKYGLIDSNAKVVLPFVYTLVERFSENRALVVQAGKYGFIDRAGYLVVPPKYDYSDALGVHNGYVAGLAKARTVTKKIQKLGLIDTLGHIVFPIKYDDLSYLTQNRAAVQVLKKWGYLNRGQKQVIAPKYDYAWDFSPAAIADTAGRYSPLARVRKGGKFGFIDTTGKEVVPLQFEEADNLDSLPGMQGLYARVKLGGKLGLLSATGQLMLATEFDKLEMQPETALIRLEKNGKLAYYRLLQRRYLWKESGF